MYKVNIFLFSDRYDLDDILLTVQTEQTVMKLFLSVHVDVIMSDCLSQSWYPFEMIAMGFCFLW